MVPVGHTRGDLSRRWPTPRWLILLSSVILVLTIALGVFLASSAGAVRGGFDVIGRQAAPQVKVSSDLYFALSDLDAQAANVLLLGDSLPLARTAALAAYQQRRVQADADLEQAAADTGGDPRIAGELNQLGNYEALVAQAFLLDQSAPEGKPAAAALVLYRQAEDSMVTIVGSAQTLIDANHNLLDSTYTAKRTDTVVARVWLILLGLLLIAALIALQFVLWKRQRRRSNPALLGATGLTLLLVALGFGALSSASSQLYVAKSNAFDSIIALSQARSVSYDANADESRYLLDAQRTDQYKSDFLTRSNTVRQDLRTELNNITFPGEGPAAQRAVQAFQTYLDDDARLRELDLGSVNSAIAYDIGTTPGNDDYDFTQYDNDLLAVIQINQTAFDAAVRDGQGAVSAWTLWLPGLGALLIIGLAGLGVWPRLAEYRR